jgi:hypothetical protein
MPDQEIQGAKERVQALRKQIRAEQNERAVAAAEADRDVRVTALTEEERHLEQMLTTLRESPVPGADSALVPTLPGGRVESLAVEDLPEGASFTETVDAFGNLVRTTVSEENTEVAPEAPAAADEAGTREADAPPLDVPDDATMTSRMKRP